MAPASAPVAASAAPCAVVAHTDAVQPPETAVAVACRTPGYTVPRVPPRLARMVRMTASPADRRLKVAMANKTFAVADKEIVAQRKFG